MASAAGIDPSQLSKALEFGVGLRSLGQDDRDEQRKLYEAKLVSLGQRLVLESERTTWDHRRKRALNMAIFRDQHQARWDDKLRVIEMNPKLPRGFDARIYLNFYKAMAMTMVSRFEGMNPRARIHAGSGDQSAIDSARAAEQIITRHEAKQVKLDERIVEALWHQTLLDTAIWKLEWSPDVGKVIGHAPVKSIDKTTGNYIQKMTLHPETGEPVPSIGPDGQPEFELEMGDDGQPMMVAVREGGNILSTIHPNNFLADPTVANFDDAAYVIHLDERLPWWIYNKYGEIVQPQQAISAFSRRNVRTTRHIPPRTARICEVWLKPGRYPFGDGPNDFLEFENGFMFAFCNSKLLEAAENPYKHGKFPFIFMPCLKIPEEMFGDTIMNSLRVCQIALNKIWHQILDIQNKLGSPIILESASAPLAEKDRGNMPRIVAWQPTGNPMDRPEQWQGIAAPPAMYQSAQMILESMKQIAGWQEGGMAGGAPPNVEANVAFQTLTANDMARLTSQAHSLARGIERAFELMMWNIHQFWKEERAVTVTGDVTSTDTIRFMGSQILETFRVEVIDSSIIPQTKEQKFQKNFTMYQAGIFGQPGMEEARREFMLRVGDDDGDDVSMETLFVHRAKVENLQALQLGQVPTSAQQLSAELAHGGFMVKMQQHMKAFLSDEFQKNPRAAYALYVHMAVTEQIFSQMVASNMPPPGPPGGGAPGSGGNPPQPSNQPPGAAPSAPAAA